MLRRMLRSKVYGSTNGKMTQIQKLGSMNYPQDIEDASYLNTLSPTRERLNSFNPLTVSSSTQVLEWSSYKQTLG